MTRNGHQDTQAIAPPRTLFITGCAAAAPPAWPVTVHVAKLLGSGPQSHKGETIGLEHDSPRPCPGGPGSFDVTDLQITASETVAYCHGILRILDSSGRLTIGLRKEGGQWRIAHEHHSYPFELESG